MALQNRPSLQEVNNEFANNSRPAPRSLRQFYEKAINSSSSGGRLSDFGGIGQPEGSTSSPASIGSGGITARLNLSLVGSPKGASYYFLWWQGHGSMPGSPNQTGTQSTSSTGNKTALISGLSPETDYSYRGVIYNPFNDWFDDVSTNDHALLGIQQVTTEALPLDTPNLTDVNFLENNQNFNGQDYLVTFSNYDSNASAYRIRYRLEGDTDWAVHGDLSNLSHIAGSTYQGNANAVGDTILRPTFNREFQIQAHNNTQTSDWSNTFTETDF